MILVAEGKLKAKPAVRSYSEDAGLSLVWELLDRPAAAIRRGSCRGYSESPIWLN